MLKGLILKVGGITQEQFATLRDQIQQLKSEKKTLELQLEEVRQAVNQLERRALQVEEDTPLQSFLIGNVRVVGDNKAGHRIYEILVDGVNLPIRVSIDDS